MDRIAPIAAAALSVAVCLGFIAWALRAVEKESARSR